MSKLPKQWYYEIMCGKCRFWDATAANNPMLYNVNRHGICRATRAMDISEKLVFDPAFIPADFDYMPLVTRSDFGCVRFDAIDEDD